MASNSNDAFSKPAPANGAPSTASGAAAPPPPAVRSRRPQPPRPTAGATTATTGTRAPPPPAGSLRPAAKPRPRPPAGATGAGAPTTTTSTTNAASRSSSIRPPAASRPTPNYYGAANPAFSKAPASPVAAKGMFMNPGSPGAGTGAQAPAPVSSSYYGSQPVQPHQQPTDDAHDDWYSESTTTPAATSASAPTTSSSMYGHAQQQPFQQQQQQQQQPHQPQPQAMNPYAAAPSSNSSFSTQDSSQLEGAMDMSLTSNPNQNQRQQQQQRSSLLSTATPQDAAYGGTIMQPMNMNDYHGNNNNMNDPLNTNHNNYDVDWENELPLLEELGINLQHIVLKTKAVVIPSSRLMNLTGGGKNSAVTMDPAMIVEDADLAGPLAFALLLGGELLLTGKIHFGYIYGFGLFGCLAMTVVLNLMSPQGAVSIWTVTSILGYCLLPVNILALVKILLVNIANLSTLGRICGVLTVVWSTTASTRLLEVGCGMRDQRYLIAYPIALLYSAFVLITIF
jgi:hypothetical protein